jgi:hypothetical protein
MTKSKRMRWAGYIARMWEKRNSYVIVGKAGRKVTTKKTKT